ncbi:Sec-independent protein translocase subunit TatB [Rahnella sp. SL6]|uniref:Sec-independent protein translocase protein TatB n=1 Tax=Rahnella perminowiae TaxID=2816244 RepID=A0ABS6KWE9_9GAMM|nr:Sec-independent protein translocase protein TatB [Rahnella sp. CFA14(1/10)]MBU9812689.1 Sec-independent protein translocase subunit TatB [Rahnella perminowiae]MBU9825324.1 Sec-independent protein translocase subunit TatB [Rahnella perminowiae]MBU9833922.1 Sec-independent protein translocase subunit TatB [Rahnella perminowiae]MCR8999536.1 Sec-independent protein translocase protein TatB [Rahnella perminowiae]
MFDIGFSELLLVLVIGLVVLGPERLPVAVRTVAGWIRTLRAMAASVQSELSQELKLQELQDSLKKAEESGLKNLTPEIKASMDELKEAAESMKQSINSGLNPAEKAVEDAKAEGNTIHNPVLDEAEAHHDAGVSPAAADKVISAPAAAPQSAVDAALASNRTAHAAAETLAASVEPVADSSVDVSPVVKTAAEAPVEEPTAPVKPASSTQTTGER